MDHRAPHAPSREFEIWNAAERQDTPLRSYFFLPRARGPLPLRGARACESPYIDGPAEDDGQAIMPPASCGTRAFAFCKATGRKEDARAL